MAAYYNEIEPYAAEWLRNLIKAGHIPDGEVDTRSIIDVAPDDLRTFTQCHFFAGIGGWGLALRLARWPDDRPIWTGSCPCQPFSVAGKGAGVDDPRHLWPHFHRLIAACRPPVVMGEQVAGAAGYGWLDGVRADLARENYASRGVDIPACSVDAPHIRQRLYWVATDLADTGHMRWRNRTQSSEQELSTPSGLGSATAPMDNAASKGLEGLSHFGGVAEGGVRQESIVVSGEGCGSSDMAHASDERRQGVGLLRYGGPEVHEASGSGAGHMANPDDTERRQNGAGGDDDHRDQAGRDEDAGDAGACHASFWSDHIWLTGADGKSRRAKPGLPLLVDGVSNCLANVLSICEAASKRITDHAERSQTDPGEILRMVREYLYKGADREKQPTGVCGKLYAPQVLFDFMLSQAAAWNGAIDSGSVKKAGKETVAGAMRIMRMDGGFVYSSHQWRSNEQQRIQSSDPLHELSFLLACDAQAFGEAVFDAHAAINRVSMLRAYGNAIVPQVAAEVIMAFAETQEPA